MPAKCYARKSKKDVEDPEKYPRLMFITDSKNVIVLFSRPKVGTVVSSRGEYPLGFHSEGWSMEFFEDYEDDVVLRNVK